MRPVLFTLRLAGHALPIPSYGVLVALGFTLGILWFLRLGVRAGYDGGRLQDLAFASVVSGLVGARLAFVLVNARAFAAACFASEAPPARGDPLAGHLSGCLAPLRFWEGGFVFFGGAVAVAAVVFVFCKRERWSFLELGDLAVPALALGHGIGRLGCLLAGCCYGIACAAPWAVAFPPGSVAFEDHVAAGRLLHGAARTVPLHPTQLYEALGELILALVLWRLQRGAARRAGGGGASTHPLHPGPRGVLLTVYLASYALLRFAGELVRGDEARGFVVRWHTPALAAALGLPPTEPVLLSTSQLMSLLVMVAAILTGVLFLRRRPPSPEAGSGRGAVR